MGLRINTNVSALNASRTLSRSTIELNRSLERLASGLRINRAADDAAGLAVAEGFRSIVRGSIQVQKNTQDGINLVQTFEGSLGETTNILQRIRELALQSANGTQSTTNQKSIDTEVQQLLSQIDDIAFDTEFNGIHALSAGTNITLQSGFQQSQTLVISVQLATAKGLSVDKLNVSITSTAVKAISQIDVALQSVNSLRAVLGAQQNRLEFSLNTLAIQEENAAASESAIRDADIARETIGFTRNQILVTAGTAVLAQANVVPQTALTLLG